MKKMLLALLMLLVAAGARAEAPSDALVLPLISDYDLDSTSYTYCTTLGDARGQDTGNVAPGAWRKGRGAITTSGSSTTVVSKETTGAALAGLAAGDEMRIGLGGNVVYRYVVSVVDADSIVVNSAIELDAELTSGSSYVYRKRSCGTAATSGWFPVAGWGSFTAQVEITQMAATGGIDVKVDCRIIGSVATTGVSVFPATNYAAATSLAVRVDGPWDECRIGAKITTADDGVTITNATNDALDFHENITGDLTADIAAGLYNTGAALATEITTKMNAVAVDNTYLCTYSESTRKFTIARATGTEAFDLEWLTGANTATGIHTTIGYSAAADDTGATSYVADNAVTIDNSTSVEQVTMYVTGRK